MWTSLEGQYGAYHSNQLITIKHLQVIPSFHLKVSLVSHNVKNLLGFLDTKMNKTLSLPVTIRKLSSPG